MWLYVYGHELTHAWAVWLSGGKVMDFRVTSEGGYVRADRVTWFIGLAPYFVPLYLILWVMLWMSINFWYPLTQWEWIYYLGLGLTWSFHLTFSLSMISIGQTDITDQGRLFSFSSIVLANLLLVLVAFVLGGSGVDWGLVANRLMTRLGQTYADTWSALDWCWQFCTNPELHQRAYRVSTKG